MRVGTDRSCADILWELFEFPIPTFQSQKVLQVGVSALRMLKRRCAFAIRDVIRWDIVVSARPDTTFCRDRRVHVSGVKLILMTATHTPGKAMHDGAPAVRPG